MEQATLKKLRLIIPGIIILAELYILIDKAYSLDTNELLKWENSIVLFVCVGIGAIYHMLNFRSIVVDFTGYQINENIKNTLLRIYDKNLNVEETTYLKDDRRLTGIFYDFVDHDSTLSVKSKNVYFNGAFWSTTADAIIISIVIGYIYVLSGIFYWNDERIILGGYGLIFIGFVFIPLHRLTVRKHIVLSNEQLEIIKMKYSPMLIQKIDDVLRQMY